MIAKICDQAIMAPETNKLYTVNITERSGDALLLRNRRNLFRRES